MIFDSYGQWPFRPVDTNPLPSGTTTVPLPSGTTVPFPVTITDPALTQKLTEIYEQLKLFLETVEKAKEYAIRTNQPNCEDPEKAKVLDEINERMSKIEIQLGIKHEEPAPLDLSKVETHELLKEIEERIGKKYTNNTISEE